MMRPTWHRSPGACACFSFSCGLHCIHHSTRICQRPRSWQTCFQHALAGDASVQVLHRGSTQYVVQETQASPDESRSSGAANIRSSRPVQWLQLWMTPMSSCHDDAGVLEPWRDCSVRERRWRKRHSSMSQAAASTWPLWDVWPGHLSHWIAIAWRPMCGCQRANCMH